ncbi:uncharacterized protein BDR25DRAFT_303413 [Lindgomyces ingoldianus]|uniref:Uncharacterized protein n=1 Tax=Lindgomyces ingoldianus TaxID=673940 RepID=A0ACB6QWV6_9PLEO|nr:uncharacterized protein BDR25DRAFT_303413 [Lindgomyces ingoldianus]KAF2471391.1 hypothetical protein BDR25DRAFT_303413 [Lindgomyces ingoldianus]
MEDEYDTDTISVTSTVESEKEATYAVKDILAETVCEDGSTKYLVQWEGYPLHRCTWEPVEHFDGSTSLLDVWAAQMQGLDDDEVIQHNEDNIARFELAVAAAEEAHEMRKKKREKKRRKLISAQKASRRAPFDESSDGKDDIPLASRVKGKLEQGSPLFVQETQKPRRPPFEQSSSSDGSDTEDSLLEELRADQQQRRSSVNDPSLMSSRNLLNSKEMLLSSKPARLVIQEKKTETKVNEQQQSEDTLTAAPNATASQVQTKKVAPSGSSRPLQVGIPATSATSPPSASAGRRASNPANSATLSATTLSTAGTAARIGDPSGAKDAVTVTAKGNPAPIMMRRSAPSAIRMINAPSTNKRRGWENPNTQFYTKMHFRRKAELRGRNEKIPDLSVLQFVNGSSVKQPKQDKNRDDAGENPYGRRETGRRRIQDDEERANSAPPEWEASKIPLTCCEWRNGSCPYSAEKCRFLHRDGYKLSPWDGSVPPKYRKPPLTCWWWMRDPRGCANSPDECLFAHYNTGLLGNRDLKPPYPIDKAERPVFEQSLAQYSKTIQHPAGPTSKNKKDITCSFWNQGHCRKSEQECAFAHRHTGQIGSAITCEFWRKGQCRHPRDHLPFVHRFQENLPWPVEADMPDAATELPFSPVSSNVLGPPTNNKPVQVSKTAATKPTPSGPALASRSLQNQENLACIDLKHAIEEACKVDFKDMFVDNEGNALDRRAFLVFHPEDNKMELELITRWLLMHHVEVCSIWKEGAWDYFKQQIMNGGTGVIIRHPDFHHFWKIPDFREILERKVRIWSVGRQRALEYDPEVCEVEVPDRYDRIEIFPHGGVIYITDDVFIKQPKKALRIIELFFNKINACRQVNSPPDEWRLPKDGMLLWRLATRPELMEAIYEWTSPNRENLDPTSLAQWSRKLYSLLGNSGYIPEDQVDASYYANLPEDYFPILSLSGPWKPDYYSALLRSQEEANDNMIEFYAQWMIDHARDYRHFFVVHPEPERTDWEAKWAHLDEVITPDECIEYFSMPPKGARFDFFEWSFSRKIQAGEGDIV